MLYPPELHAHTLEVPRQFKAPPGVLATAGPEPGTKSAPPSLRSPSGASGGVAEGVIRTR